MRSFILCLIVFSVPIFAQRLNDPYFPKEGSTIGAAPEDAKPYVGPKKEGPLALEYYFTDLEKNDCQCFCENS